MTRIPWTAVVVATLSLMAADAFAQRGAIRGKLVDEEGKPVKDVECVVGLSGGGGRTSTLKSNKNGEFLKNGVQPGTYTITCAKDGFRSIALATQVSGFDMSELGEHVLYKLAPGELSETDHARATELLEDFKESSSSDDHSATLESLFELAEMLPENPEIQFNIAGTYEKMGDDAKALEHYSKATELKPDFYDAWTSVADLHGRQKQWAEAAEAMKKALDLKATDPITAFNYGVYAQNAGDSAAAKTGYAKALELDPTRAMAHYQLGLLAVGEGANDVALSHFEKFIELAPNDPQVEAAKGVIDALKAKSNQQ